MRRSVSRAAALGVITGLAFAARLWLLTAVPARWDEGWSAAHASLPLLDLLWVTGADVHPPLYYLVLGAWHTFTGPSLGAARYLSVLLALPAVPLAGLVARAWLRGQPGLARRAEPLAAAAMAWMPLHLYYSGVVRMYALAPTFVLLAAWGALALAKHPRRAAAATIAGLTGGMLTLYHTVWALAALGVFACVGASHSRAHLKRLIACGLAAALAYLPWAVYGLPRLLARAGEEAGRNTNQQLDVWALAATGLRELTLSGSAGWAGPAVIGLIVLAAAGVEIARRRAAGLTVLALPALMIAATLLGVAAAARNWAFNARMLIAATPAVALLLAWALAALRPAWRAAAAIGLAATFFGASTVTVYERALEVFEPYDPHTYAAHLLPRALAGDAIIFNVLSPAGFFQFDRAPARTSFSYALTWDPVIEPAAQWQARITALSADHTRMWLVLYRGLARANGDLRGWMDTHLYPAYGEWGDEEVYYGLYGVPQAPLVTGPGRGQWGGIALRQADCSASARAGDVIAVALTWRTSAASVGAPKVFVHALDAAGKVVAQHDAQPLNDLRPFNTLPPGQDARDPHGLALPATAHGDLRIVAGLYDPASGRRVALEGGGDAVEVCRVTVE